MHSETYFYDCIYESIKDSAWVYWFDIVVASTLWEYIAMVVHVEPSTMMAYMKEAGFSQLKLLWSWIKDTSFIWYPCDILMFTNRTIMIRPIVNWNHIRYSQTRGFGRTAARDPRSSGSRPPGYLTTRCRWADHQWLIAWVQMRSTSDSHTLDDFWSRGKSRLNHQCNTYARVHTHVGIPSRDHVSMDASGCLSDIEGLVRL